VGGVERGGECVGGGSEQRGEWEEVERGGWIGEQWRGEWWQWKGEGRGEQKGWIGKGWRREGWRREGWIG